MRIIQPLPTQTLAPQAQPEAALAHKNRFSSSRMAGSQPVWHPKTPVSADFSPQLVDPATGTPSGVPSGKQMGFKDFLDVINPLQHIPLVSTLYRRATGDTISPAAQFMGGALFGGPLGAAASMVDVAISDHTGKGFTDNVAALVTDSDNAFKEKTPDLELATTDGQTLNNLTPASGHVYAFGTMPRTAGLMPVWGEKPATPAVALASADPISPDTGFAVMLQRLDDSKAG